jgi:hypothetical protein
MTDAGPLHLSSFLVLLLQTHLEYHHDQNTRLT